MGAGLCWAPSSLFERLLLLASVNCSDYSPHSGEKKKKAQKWQVPGKDQCVVSLFLKSFILVSAGTSGPPQPHPTWDSFTDCHINWGPVSSCLLWTERVEDRWRILRVSSASWSSKFLRPTDTAVSGARRRWSSSLCCSSLCRICNWSSCPCCLGCGSTSAGMGTTPGEGCTYTSTAATCLWWSGRPGSQQPPPSAAASRIWSHPPLQHREGRRRRGHYHASLCAGETKASHRPSYANHPVAQLKYFMELEWASRVAKTRGDGAVKG